MLSLAKALYTLLFYCRYSESTESSLLKVQVILITAFILIIILGANAGLEIGESFAIAGLTWILLLLFLIQRWIVASHSDGSM